MAEFKTDLQSNYGWGLTFDMTGKAPAIAKRIWATLADAQAYVDDVNSSAIAGLQLSVVNDPVDANNGIYFVKTIGDGSVAGTLVKVGSDSASLIADLQSKTTPASDSGLKVDDNNKLAVKIDPASDNAISVNENGLKVDLKKYAADNATITSSDVDGVTTFSVGSITSDKVSDFTAKVGEIIDSEIVKIHSYKGTKDNFSDLPVDGNVIGDVWNVVAAFNVGGNNYPAGTNVAWDGSSWDPLGGSVDLSSYATTEFVNNSLANKADAAVTSQLRTDLDTLSDSVSTVSTNVGNNTTAIEGLTAKIGDENNGIVKDINDLKSSVQTNTGDISTIKSDITNINAAIGNFAVKSVDTTSKSGINLTLSDDGAVGVNVDENALVGSIKDDIALVVSELGVDTSKVTLSANVGSNQAGTDLQACLINLDSRIQAAAAGGVQGIAEGFGVNVDASTATNPVISVDTHAIVAANSALHVNEDNTIDLIWTEL